MAIAQKCLLRSMDGSPKRRRRAYRQSGSASNRIGCVQFPTGEDMPKSLVLIVLSSLLALPMMAQDDPKIEVFGGYQYLHAGNIDGFGDSANSNGWNVSATVNFSQHLGVAADFSGNYKTETMQNFPFLEHFHAYTYTFGPVLSAAPHCPTDGIAQPPGAAPNPTGSV